MKVALLVCDHVLNEFVPDHGAYPEMFGELLPEQPLDPWFVCDGEFPDINEYDAFIATGSKLSVYDDFEWIEKLKAFTCEAFEKGKKYVGICFGHQLIAEALGGKVEKAEVGYLIGVHEFKIVEKIPWADKQRSSYNILMLCQDQLIQLPPDSTVLTSNSECPIGMYSVGSHFLGIQGHPEFSKEYNEAVFRTRPDQIVEEKISAAIQSFQKEPDTEWLRNLIMQFLMDAEI